MTQDSSVRDTELNVFFKLQLHQNDKYTKIKTTSVLHYHPLPFFGGLCLNPLGGGGVANADSFMVLEVYWRTQ